SARPQGKRLPAGPSGRSRGVRRQGRVSCTPPLCGARLRAERAWPGHSFPRCLGPAGERRGGLARLWGTPVSPAGLTDGGGGSGSAAPRQRRDPRLRRHRLALRPARRNLASRLCPEVSCWYKYLLFSYNIVFWLAGVAFLAAGLWAWSEKGVLSDLTKVTGLHGLDPVVLVLVVGIVMFTLGFAGCVGALRENICLLKFFCGTIVFIFLLEMAVAVMAFLFQDWVRDRVKEFFENNIKSYRDDIDLQNIIDSLQRINHCCGAQGPEDWDFNIYFDCKSESKSREKCGVPFSCCIPDPAQKVVNTQCGYDIRKKSKSQWDDQIFVKGCIHALEAWLPRNIYIVAGVFIAISLLQIFGIFLARTLISDIEAVKASNAF
ncbi:Tetraspanin-14, partial [Lamprotornis superbus]